MKRREFIQTVLTVIAAGAALVGARPVARAASTRAAALAEAAEWERELDAINRATWEILQSYKATTVEEFERRQARGRGILREYEKSRRLI